MAPDISPRLFCDTGDEVALQTRDAFDGQVDQLRSAEDVRSLDLTRVHPLTGPVHVQGAQPGDILEIELLAIDVGDSGYTLQVPGFGFLRDDLPDEPFLVRWTFNDGLAESDELPGLRIPGAPFPGTLGVAPSRALLEEVNRREGRALASGGLVLPPDPTGAVPDDLGVAQEAWRTIPPRETGGNIDIKQLRAGTSVFLPVFVEGALFSIGDAHFAQGDGEACGTAIETSATIRVRCALHEGLAATRRTRDLRFTGHAPSPSRHHDSRRAFVATTGISVTQDGENRPEDLTLAARNALLNMIDYLVEQGWNRQQAYIICSVAADLKVSALVDVPNMMVSAFLPLDIFQE